jgi:uncharacterized protein
MSIQENVQIVKDFFAAMGGGDKQGLLALSAEDIEWIIPGEDWPLAVNRQAKGALTRLWCSCNHSAPTSLAWSRSIFARPYIWRLMSLRRVI